MPLQLQKYWLAGKGAAKIRWNVPGDFMRCVRALTKYFPKDPKGLCEILHEKATGGSPGHGSAEKMLHHAAFTEQATALLAAQPVLGNDLWAGPLAPINVPTGEPNQIRIFEPDSVTNRVLPLPLRHRRMEGMGHQGAITVGRILGMSVGPDENGQDWVYGWGDWLDSTIIPEVTEAKYLVDQGVAGASLDPGGPVRALVDPNTGAHHMMEYVTGGATLVAIPAFSATRLFNLDQEGMWPDDDQDMADPGSAADNCGCGDAGQHPAPVDAGAPSDYATFAVNTDGWRGLPLAPREAPFDNDNAVKRISDWANVDARGTDTAKLTKAFMWRDAAKPATDPTSYRLPLGDIVNGKLTLVYHAIYAAAALLSGAHGGLPDVPDADKNRLRQVISDIYPEMAKAFNDSSIQAPWDRPANTAARADAKAAMSIEGFAMADNPKQPYGDVKYADPGYQADGKKRYPLDTPEHIRAAWSYINQADNAAMYKSAQLKAIKARIAAAMKKIGADVAMSMDEFAMATGFPVEPPAAWFEDPQLDGKTPITVEPNGRVFGHLAAWGECHRDVTRDSCVLAPRSKKGYAPFHLGHIFTAEGGRLNVGKIVMDTSHASITLGYAATATHYEHTGAEAAVVRAGEDEYGIWVAGSMVPEATAKHVAKLRRSPLSGDWRAVDGNLELTAALAVNVPAFPVYALDGETQLALVAAGSVAVDIDEDAQARRGWMLQDLAADVEWTQQRERAGKLLALTAAAGAPAAGEDPLYGPAGQAVRQADAVYSILAEPQEEAAS
jgi:uncharacterized protein DUF6582